MTKNNDINFEEALKKIQELIQEIEGGKISIDEIVEKFKEGKTLINKLNIKLEEIEKKVSEFEDEEK